jgi:hypothetical protein
MLVHPAQLSRSLLTSRSWIYSNVAGVLSTSFQLCENGSIVGYQHPNEARWQLAGNTLHILAANGRVTCKMNIDDSAGDDGQFCLTGKCLLDGARVNIHKLAMRPPSVGFFLRTHFWDEHVAEAYEQLAAQCGERPILLADVTRPFDVPAGVPVVPHSVAELVSYGLAIHAKPNGVLWYNGDYALYAAALKTDFDYLAVCEFDLCVNMSLSRLVAEAIDAGCDLVMDGTRPADSHWMWTKVQTAWDAAEGIDDPASVRKSFFPFVFISRRAVLYLFMRRLQGSFLAHRQGIKEWPFCESFVPTELGRAGFSLHPLNRFAPNADLTINQARTWAEAKASGRDMVHPALGGGRFVEKLINQAKVGKGEEAQDRRGWLLRQLPRLHSESGRTAVLAAASAIGGDAAGAFHRVVEQLGVGKVSVQAKGRHEEECSFCEQKEPKKL